MDFEDFSIDCAALELRRSGRRVELSPQAVRLLIALLERRGELVTRQDLYKTLWPGEPEVDVDRGLNTLMRQVRQALGDNPGDPRFIRTYPRRGYRFLIPTSDASQSAEAVAPIAIPIHLSPRRAVARPWLAASILLASIVATALVWPRRVDLDASIPESARESFRLGQYLLRSPVLPRRADAVSYLTETVRLAPMSARARAHLADALFWADRPANAEREASQALALDPEEPHALFMGGVLALIRTWDWQRAETLLRRGLKRDPDETTYQVVLAFVLSTAGRVDEAVGLLDRARLHDPASAILTADIGFMYLYAGQPLKAAGACEQAARLAPEVDYVYECALAARATLGELHAARTHAATLIRLAGQDEHTVMGGEADRPEIALARYQAWEAQRAAAGSRRLTFGAALAFAQAGRPSEALAALDRAAANREMGFVTITVDPRFAALHGDTRFQRLAARLVAKGAAPPRILSGASRPTV